MSCCGGNCGCGSSCGCGSACGGCKMHADLSYSEAAAPAQVLVVGVAPQKTYFDKESAEVGTESGCKCGANCTCNPCNCK